MGSKFKGVVGIARAADASSVVAPKHYLPCSSAMIDDTPIVYETDSIVSPDTLLGIGDGHKHTFSVDGIECTVDQLGYLMWLALGAQTGTTTVTLTPAAVQEYLCLQIDLGLQIGLTGSDTTMIGVGGKIGTLRCEITKHGFAKVAISGQLCDLGTEGASLTAVVPTGADEAPLSWQSLKDGSVQLGFPSLSADTQLTRVAFEISRELDDDSGVDLGSAQPAEINEGKRVVTWELDKQFRGNAKTAYDAWKAQSTGGILITPTNGGNIIVIGSLATQVVGGFAKEVGASAESIMGTLQLRAHTNNGAQDVITAVMTGTATGPLT
jgi:hypothetical protein